MNRVKYSALLIFLSLLSACFRLSGEVRLPHLVGDGMVIQRDSKTRIWGWASPGEEVNVSFLNRQYKAKAGQEGHWEVFMDPSKAGGPYEMIIKATNTIHLKNILLGDVWVCSGQSNMVLPMERVKEKYPDEIAGSTNDFIRQFFVPVRYDFNRAYDDTPPGTWEPANPKNVLNFTAAGYFFAREIYAKYKIPIGLINVSAGGSPVEAWLDEHTLKEFPAAFSELKKFQDTSYVNQLRAAENKTARQWFTDLYKNDQGKKGPVQWSDAGYGASGWQKVQLPAMLDLKDERGYTNGVVWFRKEIEISPENAGKPAKLFLGRIVDSDSVYVNGQFTGTISYQYPPRRYTINPGILKAGKNSITVRVISSSGMGGFIKEKPYELQTGNQVIDLKGEWQCKTGAVSGPLAPSTFFQAKPSGLFNAMLSPVINYTIKGVIWYQGESNVDNPADYEIKFSRMISLWREKWKQGDFPFIYVQLASYLGPSVKLSESQWAEIRDAQRLSLKNGNTAMATAVDLGEWNDLHPLNKKGVGERLALAARKIAYNEKDLVYSGPLYKSFKVKNGKVILGFSNTGAGLLAKNNKLSHFEIAGKDGKFVWANAEISGENVLVWSDEVRAPAEVRYGWADNPQNANLFNKEGLPASPFRVVIK